MKQAIWGLLGIAFGGLLGWLVVRSIHWGDVINAITGANWYLFLLALVAALFAAFLEAWRWKLLLPGEKVSTARLFLVRNVGMGINNVSPVRIVGEVAQTTMLRYGNNVGMARIVSSLLLARMLDMLVTLNIEGIGLIIMPQLSGFRLVIFPFSHLFKTVPLSIGEG